MTDTIETITIGSEGMTLSLLVWRRFKRPMPGHVERILTINPGLAALGPILPVGAKINVPIPAPKKVADITPVRLW